MPLKILLNGAAGRMGKAITKVAAEMDDVSITAPIDIGDDPVNKIKECNIVIDFSDHQATVPLLELVAEHKMPVVIGTTGHTEREYDDIVDISRQIPIVLAGNFSIGVTLLNYLTKKTAQILSNDYDPEIIEMHHRLKNDAPSGTAKRLVEIICQERESNYQERYGRKGITGERPTNEIGVHCIRGGDIVGEHTVLFVGKGERIELTHKATDRQIFARGALFAAKWVLKELPGLYNMEDILGLDN
jgi:4-hydroxy-tetrahydrodipicolinate reductase